MGYSTDFRGQLNFSKPLTDAQADYINLFGSTRRMPRDVNKLQELYKGEHGFNGSYGPNGDYFAKDDGQCGQVDDGSILDYNNYEQKTEMPGLWCQWEVSEDGESLQWDGGEKFYEYVAWLRYLIKHFFSVWGVELNGEIEWRGDEWEDTGTIKVVNNVVTTIE